MKTALGRREAQLRRWSLKIDHLAAKTQVAGVRPRFDAVMYVDELKALHAIAQSKLIAFKAARDTERARLEVELNTAWTELDASFKNPMP